MSHNIDIFGDSDSCYGCKAHFASPTIKPISPFTSRSLLPVDHYSGIAK
jgi:hypothetical protein